MLQSKPCSAEILHSRIYMFVLKTNICMQEDRFLILCMHAWGGTYRKQTHDTANQHEFCGDETIIASAFLSCIFGKKTLNPIDNSGELTSCQMFECRNKETTIIFVPNYMS
mgnify:CR=1 FL=1